MRDKRTPKDVCGEARKFSHTNSTTIRYFFFTRGTFYPASRGPSIFLDKSGRGRSKGLCSQGRDVWVSPRVPAQPCGGNYINKAPTPCRGPSRKSG